MNKLLIMGFSKIAYMPYLNFYLNALNSEKIEIHVVSWRRETEKDITLEDSRIIVHEFAQDQKDEVAKWTKIWNFFRYREFVISLIKKEKFDRIIALHTFPAVLLSDMLLGKYAGKFIFDYRDYTYENFVPFKNLIGKLVKASYATFVSSDAFRDSLPALNKIYTSHNLMPDSLLHREVRSIQERNHCPLRIAFWGFIRHEKINMEIMKKLGGDTRFELHYYGREQQTAWNLKAFAEENKFSNVFFHGIYKQRERYDFAAKTDLIHNVYENDAGMQKAMSNKYYDGIIFRIPQLCMAGSYMGNRVIKEKVGMAVDPYLDTFAEKILCYYENINWKAFYDACDTVTKQVAEEYEAGEIVIGDFIKLE